MERQSLDQATILIFTPAIILGQGLKNQFEHWGFNYVELVTTAVQVLEAAHTIPLALVVLDADSEEEMNCFVLARQLQGESRPIPVLFYTKSLTEPVYLKANQFVSYPHGWLPKPCHGEDLWQQVRILLPNVEQGQQQG